MTEEAPIGNRIVVALGGKNVVTILSQVVVDEDDPALAERYIAQGEFAPGSMLSKIEAAAKFARSKAGRVAIITDLAHAEDGLAGKGGTIISD